MPAKSPAQKRPACLYLIGAGAISRDHASTWLRLAGAKAPIKAADLSAAARESFQQAYPQAQVFENAQFLLAEAPMKGDIVVVAVPPSAHAAMAKLGLLSGRAVLVEKPLAMDAAQARAMVRLAKRLKLPLACCSSRLLGTPTTESAKALLRRGRLGRPFHLTWLHRQRRSRCGIEYQPQSRWFLKKAVAGGGILLDWGPYDFAVMNDVLQPTRVEVISAWTSQLRRKGDPDFDVETQATASLRMHTPYGIVHLSYERASGTDATELSLAELEGTQGSVRWDWFLWTGSGEEVFTSGGSKVQEKKRLLKTKPGQPDFKSRPLVGFWRALHGQAKPLLSLEQTLFNFECLMAIYKSAKTGKPQTVKREKP